MNVKMFHKQIQIKAFYVKVYGVIAWPLMGGWFLHASSEQQASEALAHYLQVRGGNVQKLEPVGLSCLLVVLHTCTSQSMIFQLYMIWTWWRRPKKGGWPTVGLPILAFCRVLYFVQHLHWAILSVLPQLDPSMAQWDSNSQS